MPSSKTILFVFVFVLLGSSLFAIEEKGVKIGVNYGTLTGDNTDHAEFKTNFSIGAFATQQLNSWLVLQPELLFSSRGANYSGSERIDQDNDRDDQMNEDPADLIDNDNDGLIDEDPVEPLFDTDGHYQLYYLELPILFKASTERFVSSNLNLILGPSINILLDGRYEFSQSGTTLKGDLTGLNAFDLSGIFGIEYISGRYHVELRANHSLIANDFLSAGEAMMKKTSNGNNYANYCSFDQTKGNHTSISLILGMSF